MFRAVHLARAPVPLHLPVGRWPDAGGASPRLLRRHDAGAQGVGTGVSRVARSQADARGDAAPDRASAPRRLALRQGQRRVDAGASSRTGAGRARSRRFDVLFPTPKERLLEMVAPTRFTRSSTSRPLAVDPTSESEGEQLPTYNAYSIDGDVTAPLVYVNYGMPDDYEQLERLGVSVKGAIVIARYGKSWRGIKPKVAAEHGAVGCLIYSDPRDDGYFGGDVFPTGRCGPSDGVQRGSVMDMPALPGRSAHPWRGRHAGATRLTARTRRRSRRSPCFRFPTATRSRCWPPSTGPLAPAEWRGGLPITYHIGPGPAKVHLKAAVQLGHEAALQRDRAHPRRTIPTSGSSAATITTRWVNGAEDPCRGMVALLEEARALGALQARVEAEAHHHLRRLGRRRAGAARLHRMGRNPRRRAAPASGRLHQHRRQRPRLPRSRRIALARALHQ